MTITPHKKSIVNLHLPSSFAGANDWITSLPDGVFISQLSIPGTANSFSGNTRNNQVDEKQRTQTASIQEQWNAGVRCFELRSDVASESSNLSEAQLQCNRQSIGVTFGEAVGEILDCLNNNPGEFVMIMPAYDGGHGTDGGGAKSYANQLNVFYNNTLSDLIKTHLTADFVDEEGRSFGKKAVTYNPNLTVGDVRGDIMFISRITSEEDPENAVQELDNGVNIAQWGSLQDNWGRRGYQINGIRASNWAWYDDDNEHPIENEVEYYMLRNNTTSERKTAGERKNNVPNMWNGVTVPKKTVDDDLDQWQSLVDYKHTSYRAGESDGTAFVQDWRRVVPSSAAGNYSLGYTTSDRNNTTHWCYWGESYSEKQADVWNTFRLCMREHEGKVGDYFFINSLDGYYVTSDIDLSYYPYLQNNRPNYQTMPTSAFGLGGTQGDIASFANDINGWFYGRLLEIGFNNMTGPVNIIILDRVLSAEGTSGYLLPQVIIDNNFKFPLMTASGSTAE